MKNKYIVNIGDRYGHYTVIEKLENNFWLCRCDCGKEKKFYNNVVHTLSMCKSCARNLDWQNPSSLMLESRKSSVFRKKLSDARKGELYNGDTANEYRKVSQYFGYMHRRVNGEYKKLNRPIADEWSLSHTGYCNFKLWLLSELSRLNLTLDDFNSMHNMELTVDRIDNNQGYSPDNCRLATQQQQSRNRSWSKRYNGEHILDIADRYNISYKTMYRAFRNKTIPELLLNH